ncbi:cell wall-active antibiotics response protein LiaF [Radiobacillus kanasensis]|uniref:cell wall-active antibiotics response protein LiaF n=1 Tax=Radiobacillus kanasensis TaxID=2844358 RepID=UPI001E4E75F2|nr:cell wall-active antibiotics response protein LiaF [Radiobacillus kanasensis]UFU00499.1 cell wall-active antibiotics response protein LiaF [Radiobacillus kanasensis]
MKSNHFFRNIVAIIVILAGVALILANLGVIEWNIQEAWVYVYPAFFVLLGLKWLLDAVRGRGGVWGGLFLVIFGGLLLLDRFDVLDFTFFDFYKLWPLLIVYLGFSIFGTSHKRKRKRNFQFIFDTDDHKGKEEAIKNKQKFVIGDHKFNSPNWKVEPMDLWNAVGDYHIDFTKAFIPDKEIPITIQGWAGDIRVLMPENLEFRLKAQVKAGDIKLFGHSVDGVNRELNFETENYETATRKLDIYLNLKAGSIKVNKV